MSDTRWTRGEWRTVSEGYRILSSGEDGNVQIAIVGGRRDDEDMAHCHERWNADAALIAAAPKLYEALENLLAVVYGDGGTKPNAHDVAEKALAKAEWRVTP
ncbi:MAG: hypothetical protein FKY71_19495 [Spiribacter salinus]|uniref:Uncharacterized protein n=1 Tax=Spiribacter salinus TaxID=1335746 RepID=A0A540V7B9_9GAMM|nr:MAG: hypothetical protein FKY71_19495 [Spiribacter salinus]